MSKPNKKDSCGKKKPCRCVVRIIAGIVLFMLGIFIGIHWRVIRALIKGEELPEIPAGHCHAICRK